MDIGWMNSYPRPPFHLFRFVATPFLQTHARIRNGTGNACYGGGRASGLPSVLVVVMASNTHISYPSPIYYLNYIDLVLILQRMSIRQFTDKTLAMNSNYPQIEAMNFLYRCLISTTGTWTTLPKCG